MPALTEVIRILGNVGAHDYQQNLSEYDAHVINEFFRAVVEYVYVAPSGLKDYRYSLARFSETKSAGSQDEGTEPPHSTQKSTPQVH